MNTTFRTVVCVLIGILIGSSLSIGHTLIQGTSAISSTGTIDYSRQGTMESSSLFNGIVLHAKRDFDPEYIPGQYYDEATYWGAIQELGVDWVRVDIHGNFPYIAEQAHARGLKVLALLHYTEPTLAAWNTRITNIKNTYGSYADAWEILNEPNNAAFQGGYIDGSPLHIFQMTRDAAIILRPLGKPIIGLPMSPTNQLAIDMVEYAFANGIANYIDYLGLHQYGLYIWGGWHEAKLQAMVNAAGSTPTWFTEFGVQSGSHSSGFSPGLDGQADWLRTMHQYVLDRESSWRIKHVCIYKIADHSFSDSYEETFGMLTGDLHPKPVFYALKDLNDG